MIEQKQECFILPLITINGEKNIPIHSDQLCKSISSLIQHICSLQRYLPNLFLYEYPLSAFNKLPFINTNVSLVQVLHEYPNICVAYNNNQFIQQSPLSHQPQQSYNNPLFVIIETFQQYYFHHQTFKLSTDCKILFLTSLAQRYGGNPALIYFDFRLPLTLFGKNETIKDTIAKFCYPTNHLVISVQNVQENRLFKKVKNKKIVDISRYTTFQLEDQKEHIVINKMISLAIMNQLLPLVFQSQIELIDQQGNRPNLLNLNSLSSINNIKLVRKVQNNANLQKPLFHSIFIGTTSRYLCFVEQSYLLHLFSSHPPYHLINSVILHSPSSLYLDQEIPILLNDMLIMYSITKSAIMLKHYQLPEAKLVYTKHFNWNSQYGPIKCRSLDMLAVPIKKKSKSKIFYIYQPNNYLQIDCPEQQWEIWVSKHARNNFSDGSGIFAIAKFYPKTVQIYNFHKKQKLSSFSFQGRNCILFHPTSKMILTKVYEEWVEYDYEGHILNKYKLEAHQSMYYSPKGKRFILTEKSFRWLEENQAIRIEDCLLKQGQQLFSKDTENQFHSIQTIHILQLGRTGQQIDHASFQKFSN